MAGSGSERAGATEKGCCWLEQKRTRWASSNTDSGTVELHLLLDTVDKAEEAGGYNRQAMRAHVGGS